MNPLEHPFSRYGVALTLVKSGKVHMTDITGDNLLSMLRFGLEFFRLQPIKDDGEFVYFDFIPSSDFKSKKRLIQSSGLADEGYFLAPHALTTDKSARQLYNATLKLISRLENGDERALENNTTITMSISPVTSKINQGKLSQSNPKAPLLTAIFCAITNLTAIKPALSFNLTPTAIIPDLELEDLIVFIHFFEKMLHDNTQDLNKARKRENSDKVPRPKRFNGNFPYAPHSHAFGAVGLLGAIGQWSKKIEYREEGLKVLDSLKHTPLYIINYDKTEVVSYDHFIVELAKEAKLSAVINALEFSNLLSEEKRYKRGRPVPKYELFWMMSNRFLQLFNKPAFQDFLSYRAEYQPEVLYLLNKYFMKKEKISPGIVSSARELGRWLNLAAYIAASNQFLERRKREPNSAQDRLEIRKFKSKFLLEAESAAFSAKSPEALLHQVIRRAGQLSYMDAPAESQEFMDAVCTGEITLDQAKNLLMAYSRLKNFKEKQTIEEEADDLLSPEELESNQSINT